MKTIEERAKEYSLKDFDRYYTGKEKDEDYLNGLIKKAKKSWEGVDVDSFMSDLRDEEEQKATEEQI